MDVDRPTRRFVGAAAASPELDTILATVLFTDVVGSTAKQAALGDRPVEGVGGAAPRDRARCSRALAWDRERHCRDGFYATFDGPAQAIRCALEIVEGVRPLGIEIRAGLHTGECEVIDGKIGGITVSIGARIASKAAPSEVLVSQTVRALVAGSHLTFEDAGEQGLKGVPDRQRLYRVAS